MKKCVAAFLLLAFLSGSAWALSDEQIAQKYMSVSPRQWGEHLPGIVSSFSACGKQAALTLDACGGTGSGCGYDRGIISYLREQRIPATLFINARWAAVHPAVFNALCHDPLFEIGNHGTRHVPLAVKPRKIYGIAAPGTVRGVIAEIRQGQLALTGTGGKPPVFFRSGTAWYDDVSVRIAADMGLRIAGFTVAADQGATLPAKRVTQEVLRVKPGWIILAHFNHPEGQTRKGLIPALEELRRRGFTFLKLSEANRQLVPCGR